MQELLVASKKRKLIIPSLGLDTEKRDGHRLARLGPLGFLPEISGGAKGYNQAGDIVSQTSDGRDLNDIWADYQAALAIYNRDRDRLTSVLAFPVTKVIEDVYQGGDTVDFERATEFGVPRGIRAAPPTYFSLGYSFDWWDLAVRFTWQFLADADTRQIDVLANLAFEADNRLQFNYMMAAIFDNVTRAATIQGQNYNVFPLYNGDATVPPRYKNVTHGGSHTHYLTSGAATVDPGDLTGVGSMYAHLDHHGYNWQEGSALILMVNSAQMATIRTFRAGVSGAEYDFITAQGAPPWALTDDDIINSLDRAGAAPPSVFRGLMIEGRYGPWLVVQDDTIPAGYMLGFASGGALDAANLVGFREHVNPGMRGMRLVRGPIPDYPLIDSYYQRGFGTGIRQRGAGVVMQVTAGAYAIPAAFDHANL